MPATVPPNAQGLLSQLRDIHTPAPIGNWPPAPGWILLAVLVLIAVAWLTWWLIHRWRANRYRREALKELDELMSSWRTSADAATYLVRYTELLKRTALTHFPRDRVANLTGEAWVDFLDRSANTDEFSMGAGQVLIEGHYRAANETVDVDELHRLGEMWIKHHDRGTLEKAA